MKKLGLLVASFVFHQLVFAQGFINYYDGTPMMEKKFTDVEGSELLFEDWRQGTIQTKEGKAYPVEKLKYNQMEDRLYFQNAGGQTMMLTTPINGFSFGDSLSGSLRRFRNGYPANEKLTAESYYEVLVDGPMVLLKKTYKNILETKAYNAATTQKQITEEAKYFLFAGAKVQPLKREKDALLKILSPRSEAAATYIALQKLNLKKESDLVALIKHLNTL